MSGDLPVPERTDLNAPYWDALADGRLMFQRCSTCRLARLPPRSECPRCLAADYEWEEAGGRGRLVSWVVYHRAYHPAFEGRLPYNVALVELEEGPRLITNLVGVEGGAGLRVGRSVRLRVEREGELGLARFEVSPGG
jgi:uncharacterized OB-fold protein